MGKCFVLNLVGSRQIFTQWECFTNEKHRECKVVSKNNLQNYSSSNIHENNHTYNIFELWSNHGHAITGWLLFQYRLHFKIPKFPNIFVSMHQKNLSGRKGPARCIWSMVQSPITPVPEKNNKFNIIKFHLNEIIFLGHNNQLLKCSYWYNWPYIWFSA